MSEQDKLIEIKEVVKFICQQAFELIYQDSHQFGTRPCQTCQTITNLTGIDFGCVRKRKERMGVKDEV